MMRLKSIPHWFLGAFLLICIACSGKSKAVKVSGRVTLDGQPLPGATIMFHPADGKGSIASGRTDANGNFRLTTFNVDDGALPGDYKITIEVQKTLDLPVQGNPMLMNEKDLKEFFMRSSPKARAAEAKAKAKDKSKPVVPPVYSDFNKTPLKQRVPPDGVVEINLQSNAI